MIRKMLMIVIVVIMMMVAMMMVMMLVLSRPSVVTEAYGDDDDFFLVSEAMSRVCESGRKPQLSWRAGPSTHPASADDPLAGDSGTASGKTQDGGE